jgi:hypothetical protein
MQVSAPIIGAVGIRGVVLGIIPVNLWKKTWEMLK